MLTHTATEAWKSIRSGRVSIFKIQNWMGHSDPRITMEHYAHLSPEYDEDINRFPVGVIGGFESCSFTG